MEELTTLQRIHVEQISDPTIALDLTALSDEAALALLQECVAPGEN
jgi:hypothetical protein